MVGWVLDQRLYINPAALMALRLATQTAFHSLLFLSGSDKTFLGSTWSQYLGVHNYLIQD